MVALQWAAEGRKDVDGVYDDVGGQELQPALADNAVRGLIAECQSLAEATASGSTPGTARPDFGETVRLFTHQRWIVLFRPIKNGIEVLRILDGSRGFSQIAGD